MRLTPRLSVALAGLACAYAAGLTNTVHAQRVPNGTNEIAVADFDLAVGSGGYGYFYSDGNIGGGYYQELYPDPPENANIVFRYTFDSTVFAGFTSWWGTGFGMDLPWGFDPSVFNSTDTADYILSFDARVEGLTAGQTAANCVMEFRLGVSGTWVIVKALPYAPGSNWTHYVFNLEEGSYIAADGQPQTSYTTFTNGIAAGITRVAFNQNQPNPTQFGPDADNAIYMDNIKLEVLQYAGPPPPPPPKVGIAILDYNWDDKPIWSAWNAFPGGNGWSQNANTASYWAINDAPGIGVGGSKAFAMAMDNSLIATDPPGVPQWAGGNAGGVGPADYVSLTSSDLKDYRLKLAARVEGLAEAQAETPITVQLSFNAPDDTIQPPDGDTNRDLLLRLNLNITGIQTNWQTFTSLLKDAAVDSGSLANFQTHFSKTDEIAFQFQIQNPHQLAVWGSDADNQIVIDDFKLERLVTGTPPLKVQALSDKVVVSWDPPSTGTVKLLQGSTVGTVTTEVVNATSPHTNAVSAGPLYFRTLWVPPTTP